MTNKILEDIKKGIIPVDFNWNSESSRLAPIPREIPAEPSAKQISKIEIVDEGLRDGLHGVPKYPSVEKMMDYMESASKLGIKYLTVGIYPGKTSPGLPNKVDSTIKKILSRMRDEYPHIIPIVLSLATPESSEWLGKCKQIHPNLEAIIFMGTAPSRLLVEKWEQRDILERLAWAVTEATEKYKVKVIGATEHTTQTPPQFLKEIIKVHVRNGAQYFCIADTIGIARPIGTTRIVKFVKDTLDEMGAYKVKIDWHGHRDLGNGLANAMAAIAAGADRIHVVADGIGERAGNTSMQEVLINCNEILSEQGYENLWNMKYINEVLETYSDIVNIPRPSHGTLGKRAFKTSLGIHSAAMNKAEEMYKYVKKTKDSALISKFERMASRIYTAIDPDSVGRNHEISVGPWSGKSTVILACESLGYDSTKLSDSLINHILLTAKNLRRELTNQELRDLVSQE